MAGTEKVEAARRRLRQYLQSIATQAVEAQGFIDTGDIERVAGLVSDIESDLETVNDLVGFLERE